MTDGTTLCPHCATRFRIAEAQLNAHGGMVRCGHCRQAFDARTNYQPDQPSPQLDLPIGPDDQTEVADSPHIVPETDVQTAIETPHDEVFQAEAAQIAEPETPANETATPADEPPSLSDTAAQTEAVEEAPSDGIETPAAAGQTGSEADNAAPAVTSAEDNSLDFSHSAEAAETQIAAQDEPAPTEYAAAQTIAEAIPALPTHQAENDILLTGYQAQHDDYAAEPPPAKRRVWPWLTGILILLLVLTMQSAYFFRIRIAAEFPALKPALLNYCDMLGCNIPLPRDAELISIESSSLDADADHANQVNLDALLRNRASHTLAFPALSLTLNDMQDKPLATRVFLPADYLPANEKEAIGLAANHELSIQLRMDTGDLRPIGYRLELFYPQ